MSSIEILKNFYDYGTSGISNIDNLSTTPLTFTKWSKEKLIYCNHPEQVKAEHYGEKGKFLNRVVVEANKKVLLYASYELTKKPLIGTNKLAVRVFNPNSTVATVEITKMGYNCTDNYDVACDVWKDYAVNRSKRIKVNSKQSEWIIIEDAPQKFVELLSLFETDSQIVVAVYVCENVNKIPAETTFIKKTENVYSGWSENYSLHAQDSLFASKLLKKDKCSIFYRLGVPCHNNKNVNESIPINMVQGGIASFGTATYNNLGNWGIIYHFAMTIRNDTQKTVKFRAYVISNNDSHCAGIQSGYNADAYHLGINGSKIARNKMIWHFYESRALEPGEFLMPEFNYSILSKGSSACAIQFEVVEV